MGQFHRAVFACRNQVMALALGLALLFVALAALPVAAQSGCTGDPCVFHTPTATPTGTPAPTPGPGTPTAVPMPQESPFPRPNYGIPTSIPNLTFPPVPSPVSFPFPTPQPEDYMTPQALAMPSPIPSPALSGPGAALTQTNGETLTLLTMNSSIDVAYPTPMGLNTPITSSSAYTAITGINEGGRGIITSLLTYTDYLSNEITNLQYTQSLTIGTAPSWYAPYMPRPMADIGWTFEQVGEDSTARYSLTTWSYLFGSMAAMPIQLARGLLDLFRFLGPFGLFMIWLIVIMLPAVLGFRLLLFIKNTFIRLINFALTVIDWVLKLWNAVPWYLGGPG